MVQPRLVQSSSSGGGSPHGHQNKTFLSPSSAGSSTALASNPTALDWPAASSDAVSCRARASKKDARDPRAGGSVQDPLGMAVVGHRADPSQPGAARPGCRRRTGLWAAVERQQHHRNPTPPHTRRSQAGVPDTTGSVASSATPRRGWLFFGPRPGGVASINHRRQTLFPLRTIDSVSLQHTLLEILLEVHTAHLCRAGCALSSRRIAGTAFFPNYSSFECPFPVSFEGSLPVSFDGSLPGRGGGS